MLLLDRKGCVYQMHHFWFVSLSVFFFFSFSNHSCISGWQLLLWIILQLYPSCIYLSVFSTQKHKTSIGLFEYSSSDTRISSWEQITSNLWYEHKKGRNINLRYLKSIRFLPISFSWQYNNCARLISCCSFKWSCQT